MNDRLKMIACAVLLGICFAVGLPALYQGSYLLWALCCLVSFPTSYYMGRFERRAERRNR